MGSKGAGGRGGMSVTSQSGLPGGKYLLGAVTVAAMAFFAGISPAQAFCVENRTETRLFFTAQFKGEAAKGLIFRQWVNGGASACGAPERGPGILVVFVCTAEDAVEGCANEIAAAGALRLRKFDEFDNCVRGRFHQVMNSLPG